MSWWWWEYTGIYLKGAREKAVASEAEPQTDAVSYSESEDKLEGAAGGAGEEESLGASGSSGVEWIGVEYD